MIAAAINAVVPIRPTKDSARKGNVLRRPEPLSEAVGDQDRPIVIRGWLIGNVKAGWRGVRLCWQWRNLVGLQKLGRSGRPPGWMNRRPTCG